MVESNFPNRPFRLRENVWLIRQDIGGNASLVGWELWIHKNSYSPTYSGGQAHRRMVLDGAERGSNYSNGFDFRNGDSFLILNGEAWIGHNSDGTKTFQIDGYAAYDVLGATEVHGPFTLPTIPRASNISFVPDQHSGIFGQGFGLRSNRASGSFEHDSDYYYGNASGRAATRYADSATWNVPMDLLNQIPTTTTGVGTMRTYTYGAYPNNFIGATDFNFRLTAPSSLGVDFTNLTISEANTAVSTKVGAYVQGLSRLTVTLNGAVSSGYGASIADPSGYWLYCDGQSINAKTGTFGSPITSAGTVSVSGSITDSRGLSKNKSQNITVLPYAPPTITSVKVERALSTGVVDEQSGTYLRVTMVGAVQTLKPSTTEKNTLTFRISTRLKGTSTWTLKVNTALTAGTITLNRAQLVTGPFSITASHDVLVEIVDQFSTSAVTQTVGVAKIAQHWDGNRGVGIGKFREGTAMLDVGGPIFQEGAAVLGGNVQAMLDPNYRGEGPAKVFLPGTSTLTTEAYEWMSPYIPWENRTVELVRVNGTWAILGHSNNDAHGGFAAATLNSSKFMVYNEERKDWVWRETVGSRRLSSGIVVLSGMINSMSGTTTATGDLIGTLIPGHRPDVTMTFPVEVGDQTRSIDINPDGTIRARSGWASNTYVSLEGISYPAAGVATWTSLALLNSWVAGTTSMWGTPAYWKDPFGVVWLRGMLKSGGTAENTPMATLPAGTRPSWYTHQRTSNQDNFGFVSCDPAGSVQYKNGSAGNDGMSLAGVTVVTSDAYTASPWRDLRLMGSWSRYGSAYPAPRITRRPDGLVMTEGLIGGSAPASIFKLLPEMRVTKRALLAGVGSAIRARLDFGNDATQTDDFGVAQGGNGNSWYSLDGLKWAPGR